MTTVVLCGGSGTRLWPISRNLLPKQFVSLFEGESLFQKSIRRNAALGGDLMIVSNAEQYFLAVDQLEILKREGDRFLLEPAGRNTAPAIALAAMTLPEDEILLVVPSDHLITNEDAYQDAVARAKEFAEEGALVTFGIQPEYPETGYGYIEAEGSQVLSFKEKPDAETARRYIEKGNYYWNSGMFCFTAKAYLDALKKHASGIFTACESALEKAKTEGNTLRITHEAMLEIPEQSIDYAVMEKAEQVCVVPCDIGWSDLGSFESLYDELPKDAEGNTVSNAIHIGSANNLVLSSERQIATIDLENLMIIDTADALLVARKGSGQKVRDVVKELKKRGGELHNIHLTAHRPWGTYTVLEDSERYKIKRIVVEPGKRLSLQKHFHRNEHWIVVSGTAKVTLEDKTMLVRANESTYIHAGQLHRLENPGRMDLVMIEVQVGEYLSEDDIVRVEDDFSRE